ncbi:MAG: MotA/TolQ/ExbB proton channel family protein [Polyangiales bacterium]
MASIAEALVATAIGLAVAIPAIAAFNRFQRRIKTVFYDVDALGHVLLTYLEADDREASGPRVVRFHVRRSEERERRARRRWAGPRLTTATTGFTRSTSRRSSTSRSCCS